MNAWKFQDILGYMKLILNPNDDVAFKRVINRPARGIGKVSIEKIETYAFKNGISSLEACQSLANEGLVHSNLGKKLKDFHMIISKLSTDANKSKPSDIYHALLDATEYTLRLRTENTPESLARIDNLEEFNNAITHFEEEREEEGTLQTFLEEMALVSDVDQVSDTENMVTLMTLHVAKRSRVSQRFYCRFGRRAISYGSKS